MWESLLTSRFSRAAVVLGVIRTFVGSAWGCWRSFFEKPQAKRVTLERPSLRKIRWIFQDEDKSEELTDEEDEQIEEGNLVSVAYPWLVCLSHCLFASPAIPFSMLPLLGRWETSGGTEEPSWRGEIDPGKAGEGFGRSSWPSRYGYDF